MERLDIFPKTYDDFKERTLGGAAVSIVCCLLALLLFGAEFSNYRSVETVDRCDDAGQPRSAHMGQPLPGAHIGLMWTRAQRERPSCPSMVGPAAQPF